MRASLQLARAGLNVAVLSKVFPTRSHTVAAQGGIGASLGNMSEDNWHYHFYDTVKGSRLARRPGRDRVHVPRSAEGRLRARALRHAVRPQPGRHDLPAPVRRPHRQLRREAGAARLRRGRPHRPRDAAHAVPAERQGAHQLLRRVDGARPDPRRRGRRGRRHRARDGDRRAAHPARPRPCCSPPAAPAASSPPRPTPSSTPATAWAWRRAPASRSRTWSSGSSTRPAWHGAGVLLTEGCRGEGAILRNSDGERFMERYAPTLKDLAPRDFVSRCMDQEIKEGRGCGPNKDYIVLDMTHLGADTIMKRLPSVLEIGHNFANVDITQEPIPVVPTIHYQMGGVPTNVHGQVVAPKGGDPNAVVQRASTRSANAPASACTAPTGSAPIRCSTCWCSAAPPATTSSTSKLAGAGAQGRCRRDAADFTAGAPGAARRQHRRRVRAGRRQRPAQDDAAARRRVPHPGVDGRRRRQGRRRSPSAPGRSTSPTSRRSSTPRASRRSRSTT